MFKLDTSGNETVLHSFAGTPDGASPERGIALDTKGNIHGATAQGGAYNYGTVFKLDTSGNETVLYSFTGLGGGSEPVGVLLLAAQGNACGTTDLGGTYGYGTVFKLDKKGNETVLYSFTGAADGANPRLR